MPLIYIHKEPWAHDSKLVKSANYSVTSSSSKHSKWIEREINWQVKAAGLCNMIEDTVINFAKPRRTLTSRQRVPDCTSCLGPNMFGQGHRCCCQTIRMIIYTTQSPCNRSSHSYSTNKAFKLLPTLWINTLWYNIKACMHANACMCTCKCTSVHEHVNGRPANQAGSIPTHLYPMHGNVLMNIHTV